MIDDAVRAMADRDAAWDPLRERRVLGRVEAELDRRATRSRARRWVPAAIVGAVAAAAIAVLVWPAPAELPQTAGAGETALGGLATAVEPAPTPGGSSPAIPTMPAAAIALGDGSIATLHDGARIELLTQSSDEIRIEQSVGRVHYDVRPGLARTFMVEADDVRVMVVGTAFWVTHEATSVRVTVEHGRVRVLGAGDEAIAELGAGDELSVVVSDAADDEEPSIEIDDLPVSPSAAGTRPRKPTSTDDRRSVEDLLALVDDARARADLAAAAAALREIVDDHGGDPRAYGSAFQLGKVERSRGRHAAAARAFAKAARKSPAGALSEDARAEAAISWFDAGDHAAARGAAKDYLARHGDGTHVARVQRMLQRIP